MLLKLILMVSSGVEEALLLATVPLFAHLTPSMTLVSQSRARPACACALHAPPKNRSKVCLCPKAAAARTYCDPASREPCTLRGMDLRVTHGVHFCRKTHIVGTHVRIPHCICAWLS